MDPIRNEDPCASLLEGERSEPDSDEEELAVLPDAARRIPNRAARERLARRDQRMGIERQLCHHMWADRRSSGSRKLYY
jgi:hypothetical protein